MPTPDPSTTLPFAWYSDPAVLAREQERIFRRRWQYVGHIGQVSDPGSLSTARAGDVPVLLVRDLEGVLRAFLNVCRHRGAQLVVDEGARATIQCPYHAWTYDLDGHLLSAPRSQTESSFDPGSLGLIPLSVDCWGPFVFVNPDVDAAPLDETLCGLPDLVASAGVEVDSLRFHERIVSSYAANWKICCENFLECYHCQVAHPDLVKVIDLTLNISPGSPNISIGPVIPDGPGHTTRFLDYFFSPDADASWIRDMLAWDDQVGVEDTALVERVQSGVRSGMLARGVLFDSERLIAHFDRLVQDDLG